MRSALGPSSSSSIGRSPRRCCNTNRTIEKPRGVKSYAAGVFFIAAVKQKMKMKEIYLSKPPVLWTAAAKGSHNKSIRQALEEVNRDVRNALSQVDADSKDHE